MRVGPTAAPQHRNTAEPQFAQSSFSEFPRIQIPLINNGLLENIEETPVKKPVFIPPMMEYTDC